jgi:hypothetical protein
VSAPAQYYRCTEYDSKDSDVVGICRNDWQSTPLGSKKSRNIQYFAGHDNSGMDAWSVNANFRIQSFRDK